ncbi:MAG: helix-turn-helix domain-containing protein [bacterium]|nr:helix-turn-helix domain-containing protein [bacterium]
MLHEISTLKLLVIAVSFHGFMLSTLMAVGQLIVDRKSTKNILLFGLFFNFALLEIHTLMFETGRLANYVWLQQLNISAYYLTGPVFYWFARFSTEKSFKWHKKNMLHLLPTLLATAAVTLVVLFSPAAETAFPTDYFHNNITFAIAAVGALFFLAYLVAAGGLIKNSLLWKWQVMKTEPAGMFTVCFFLFFVVAWLFDFISIICGRAVFLELAIMILTAAITSLFLLNFKYPQFHHSIHQAVETEKEKRSYLQGVETDQICEKLHLLMTKEALYLDEELTLPLLAERAAVTTQQLSQLLNQKLQKNFKTFVNGFRIQKAAELLTKNPGQNILSIAYDVGFKSKSTFNKVFAQQMGMTPSQYRTRHDAGGTDKKNDH